MTPVATTKLSSKGQVVIPESIREKLRLEPGTSFIVMGDADVVILKRIALPSRAEFHALAENVRRRAREAGVRRSDVRNAIRAARRRG